MSIRKYANFQEVSTLFRENIISNIGNPHLDFGCGNGLSSIIESMSKRESLIVGYDPDPNQIKKARELHHKTSQPNITFSNSIAELTQGGFKTAGANFVFHEDPSILSQIYPYLTQGGKILILDYNIKGTSKRDFRKIFCFDNERRVIKKEGFEACYDKHTSINIEDCIRAAEGLGFMTVASRVSKNYFVYVGRK